MDEGEEARMYVVRVGKLEWTGVGRVVDTYLIISINLISSNKPMNPITQKLERVKISDTANCFRAVGQIPIEWQTFEKPENSLCLLFCGFSYNLALSFETWLY